MKEKRTVVAAGRDPRTAAAAARPAADPALASKKAKRSTNQHTWARGRERGPVHGGRGPLMQLDSQTLQLPRPCMRAAGHCQGQGPQAAPAAWLACCRIW